MQYLAHAAGLQEWLPLGEVLDYVARNEAPLSPSLPPVPGSRIVPTAPAPPKPAAPPVTPFWAKPNPTPASAGETATVEKTPPVLADPVASFSNATARPPVLPATAVGKTAATTIPVAPPVAPALDRETSPAPDLKPASFPRRFVAFLVDCGIVFLPVVALYLIGVLSIGTPTLWRHTNHQTLTEDRALLNLNAWRMTQLVLAMAWLYGAGMEASRRQATIGKRWLGLKVTDARGDRMTFLRATGRYAAKYLSALPCFLGFIVALFSSRGLALHDRLSGSRVVRNISPGSL